MTFYLIFALLIAIVAVVFALQNFITVTVTFLAWEVTGSLALILLLTLVIGIVVGLLMTAPGLLRRQFQLSGQRKTISKLEKKVSEHENKMEKTAEEKQPEKVEPAKKPEESKK